MRSIRPSARTSALLLAAIAGASLVGCGTGGAPHNHHRIQGNLTPEVDTLYQRRVDMDNRIALTNDENLRQFNQDLGRFWLLDRPSRLTREPTPR
jgi:hypothetical protein